MEVKASMAGSVWKVLVNTGDSVQEGDDVIILESMKMEIPIAAEMSGNSNCCRVFRSSKGSKGKRRGLRKRRRCARRTGIIARLY